MPDNQTVGQQRDNRTGKTSILFRVKPTAAVQAHLIGQEQSQLAKDENLQHMHTPINVCAPNCDGSLAQNQSHIPTPLLPLFLDLPRDKQLQRNISTLY